VSVIKLNGILKIALLTFVWIILREDFTVFTIVTGVVISIGCMAYSRKFLPLKKITNVDFFKLFLYLFYLIGQIYLSGFYVIKMILFDKARADLIEVRTAITNQSLRVVLADSITLTPGSILLDLTEDRIKVVLLISVSEPKELENVDQLVKGRLEEKLLKAQK